MKALFFILISTLTKYIISSCTGIPTKPSDCISQSDSNQYCCYLYSGTTKECVSQNKTSYKQSDMYNTTGGSYLLNCGFGSGLNDYQSTSINTFYNGSYHKTVPIAGSPCGVMLPQVWTDCRQYSMQNDTCCYYLMGDGTAGCSFAGSAVYKNYTRADGSKVICASDYLVAKITVLILSFALLILV